MNRAGSDRLSLPGLKVSHDLKLVSGALQDFKDSMQKRADSGMLQPYSPGMPPAAFGAGGPM
jgi:6-phosphofructo-2-kinase/fructose-2,6-biphosphatase 2